MVEFAITNGAIALLSQLLPHDSRDLIRMGEYFIEAAIFGDPLHSGLLADLVDSDEVVTSLANKSRDIRVLVWFDSVPFKHCIAVVSLQFRYTASVRVQQSDVVIDHLNRIAIA